MIVPVFNPIQTKFNLNYI